MENSKAIKKDRKEKNLVLDLFLAFLVYIASGLIGGILSGPVYGMVFKPTDVNIESVMGDERYLLTQLIMSFVTIILLYLYARFSQNKSNIKMGIATSKKLENYIFGARVYNSYYRSTSISSHI